MQISKFILIATLFLCPGPTVFAVSFPTPPPGKDIIGTERIVKAKKHETLASVGEEHDLGFCEMINANPKLDDKPFKYDTKVLVPSAYILPNEDREGIVISIPESRLYFYNTPDNSILTFPIAIGRKGWRTPTGLTKIVEKVENPDWIVPESIKKYALEQGRVLPDVVPAGPENPMGSHKLRLGMPGYLIHGTNNPASVGKSESSGCLRMYEKDIQLLFSLIDEGTKVKIVNNPYKIGWVDNDIYLEAHPAISDDEPTKLKFDEEFMLRLKNLEEKQDVSLNWTAVLQVMEDKAGRPAKIGVKDSDREI